MPDEDQSKALLQKMSDTAAKWAERIGTPDNFPVGDGSALQGDDAACHPFLVSHALMTCIGAAVDHLHGLYALVLTTDFLHLNTPYTVARGALESAAAAIWIAEPNRRNDRVERALSWFYKDVKDGNTAATEAKVAVPTPLQDRIDKLDKLAAARGLAGNLKGYTSTKAAEAAEAHLGPTKMPILLMWRLCSGFAHARVWPILGFTDSTKTPIPGRPGMIAVKSENSYRNVLAAALTAQQAIEAAITLYELRARGR
ncbi:hypothetical protein L6E12_20945 [Actinokineospora sp. PR83]|uniref:hypothetical protein n=1 Tax=Actinokineospora sp. PR83 TaxID=2884908 RepID=UPI001F27C9B1|nr:hypothetical protein [Actinokineospora sp. PR83]MCG8918254.1 hypothetical protein [Actinokineospora sp. PR83]